MNKFLMSMMLSIMLIGSVPTAFAVDKPKVEPDKTCVVTLSPGDEAALKANPQTFGDLGTYRVITVRGKLAHVWYEWKYNKHNIVIDPDKKVIIILILEDDV